MNDRTHYDNLWRISGVAAAFFTACIFLYLMAVPVGLFMLYRIQTQCPTVEVTQ